MSLRFAIMTALLEDELSGYDLARSFDSSIGFFWRASHQQIYRELRNLSERGWLTSQEISQSGRPDRIVYSLTDDGLAALDAWVLEKDRMRLQDTRDEFFVKLYNLAPGNIAHIHSCVIQRREEVMKRLFLYERIRRRHYATPDELPLRRKGVYLALLGGIRQCEDYLGWCDEAMRILAAEMPDAANPSAQGS